MPKLLKTEEFVGKAKAIHGNKYDYSMVEYTGCANKVKIICAIHNEFWQKPYSHLSGSGCKKCSNDTIAQKLKSTTKEFIVKASK